MNAHHIEHRNSQTYIIKLCLLLALLLTACASPSAPTPLPTGLSDVVSGKVDVGGYELYYTCAGKGSPTVILEAGGPSESSVWDLVRVYIGASPRVCAYDRANLGKSHSAPKPRTLADMTYDLHTLLQKVPIKGPYVLVGHSMGGMLVQLYASQYPEDVVGLVLVDSGHPDMGDRLLALLPPETAKEDETIKDLAAALVLLFLTDRMRRNMNASIEFALTLDSIAASMVLFSIAGGHSSIPMMLMVNVGVSALLLPFRQSQVLAILAAIGIVLPSVFSQLFTDVSERSVIESTLFGLAYIAVAALCAHLGRQMRETEALAEQRGVDLLNLEQVNDLIIRRMKTGVLLVNDANHTLRINESAWHLMGNPSPNQRDLGHSMPWQSFSRLRQRTIVFCGAWLSSTRSMVLRPGFWAINRSKSWALLTPPLTAS